MPAKGTNGTAGKTKRQNAKAVIETVNHETEESVEHQEHGSKPVSQMTWEPTCLRVDITHGMPADEGTMTQMGPLSEVLGKAQKAYSAYLEAQKEVAKAYKINEIQLEKAFKDAEQQANHMYESTIAQALATQRELEWQAELLLRDSDDKVREMERQAEEVCRETMEQARQIERQAEKTFQAAIEHVRQLTRQARDTYNQTKQQVGEQYDSVVNQALKVRDQTIEEAWETRSRTVDRAWTVFLKETGG